MDSNYLDTSKGAGEHLKENTTWSKEVISQFEKHHFTHLSTLQAAYLSVIARQKKRILIECMFAQGKTTCSFINLLSLLLSEKSEQQESSSTNLHFFIAPKFLLSSLFESFSNFLNPFSELLAPFQVQNLDSLDHANLSLTHSNVFVGTISQVIQLFATDILNPRQIRSQFFDNLQHSLSQGASGNLERWVDYLKSKDAGLLADMFIQVNVAEDEKTQMRKFKDKLGLKFTSMRILPEEESEDESAYQLTAAQTEALMKDPSKKTLLEEFLHQFYYSHSETNVFSMIYLLLKFKVFPQRTLLITGDIRDAYR